MAKTERMRRSGSKGLPIVHRHAAGIDIGATFHVVAVPADADEEPVRKFNSFTGDLHQLAEWLKRVGITTVAMESTGIYWIPVYEILEERGLEVVLVNAQHMRKSADADEPSASSCRQRYHRNDRNEYHPGDCGRDTEPSDSGQVSG